MSIVKVRYSKEMREIAKAGGELRHLVTIDLPGMCFQGPCSTKHATEVKDLLLRIIKERNASYLAKPSKRAK